MSHPGPAAFDPQATVSSPPRPGSLADFTVFSLFAACWAFQSLEEKLDRFNVYSITEWGLVTAAVATLFFPRLLLPFLAVCFFQIGNYIAGLPESVNHYVPITLINIAFLYYFGRAAVHYGGLESFDKSAVVEQVAPLIRLATVVVYFFAAFHKLNWGYFDPVNSCFVDTYGRLARLMPILPPLNTTLAWVGIVASVSVEVAIAVLLMIGRTRHLGLIIGVIFHMALGLRHSSFSTLVFVLYLVFIPRPALALLRAQLASMPIGAIPWKLVAAAALAWSVVFWTASPFLFTPRQRASDVAHLAWFVMFLLLLIIAASVLAPALRRGWLRLLRQPLSWRLKPVAALLAALLFVNGLAPYVGWKTTSAFSMYSNLRTEGGESNHWIVPKNLIQLVHYQDDLVTVTVSNYPPLQELADENWRVPFISFQRILWQAKTNSESGVQVSFIRGGQTYRYDEAEKEPSLAVRHPWYVRKFVHYRNVPPPGENRPQW